MLDITAALDGRTMRRLLDRHGPAAQAWFDGLPESVEQLCMRWRVRTTRLLAGGTSVVLRCLRTDGSTAVLKIVPDAEIARIEAVALRAWSGRRGVVDLLDGATMARSHAYALDLAHAWRGPGRLLHGDLHPGNVLDGGPGRGLVAIDTRPCLGDPNFDGIDWVHAGLDEAGQKAERAHLLAAQVPHLDADRLIAWSRATAAIAAVAHLLADRIERARPLLALARNVR